MNRSESDSGFVGSIPQLYERHMVPLMFEVYADDLAARIAKFNPARILELAAGTGVLTRALAKVLPPSVAIVASDLNQPMLDHAASLLIRRPIAWRQADAMQLPFPDEVFDTVACQFGVMFFPDKARAYAEVRRVLQPGGRFVFNVWDDLEHNEFAATATEVMRQLYPDNPPLFMDRVPHGYHDEPGIARDLAKAGFRGKPLVTTVPALARASSPRIPAVALCQGTPLRNEIESRGKPSLDEVTRRVTAAIAARFGLGAVAGRIQAKVVTVAR